MKRGTFLADTAAVAALGAKPGAAWRFPGTLALFAQRLRDERPFASLDAHRALPAASLIKLVILTGVVRAIDAGSLRWLERLRVHGSRATIWHLAQAMIARSDNTAGNVLADYLSFACVNAVAESLGLTQTRMRRHFLDFAARRRGIDNTTSAADMGALLLGMTRGALGEPSRVASRKGCRAMIGFMLQQEDRETIPAVIPRGVPVANKTGVLQDVRSDVAIVDPYGKDPYVMALLSQFDPRNTHAAYARLRAVAGEVAWRATR